VGQAGVPMPSGMVRSMSFMADASRIACVLRIA
jgi:hypothetical protein